MGGNRMTEKSPIATPDRSKKSRIERGQVEWELRRRGGPNIIQWKGHPARPKSCGKL
jgi:hypothetical protein